jgi:uncharacterized protein YjbJ (UPF0337 family)
LHSQQAQVVAGTLVANDLSRRARTLPCFFQPFGGEEITHDHQPEDIMKSSTRDKAEGKLHEVKGKVKEAAGKLTDDPKLEAEGAGEKLAGKVQGKIGQIKKVLGD